MPTEIQKTHTPNELESESSQRLLSCAAKLFAAHGFNGVGIREIANEALVNVSLISYYFGGKEGLYRKLLIDYAQQSQVEAKKYIQELYSQPITAKTFEKFVQTLARRTLTQHFENPHVKNILLRETTSGMPRSKDLFDDVFYQLVELISNAVVEAQNKGIIKKHIHPKAFIFSLVHLIDSFVLMARNPVKCSSECFQLPQDNEKLISHVTNLLLNGALQV